MITKHAGKLLLIVFLVCWQPAMGEVIISLSNEDTGVDRNKLFWECESTYCEGNKKIRYWWVYDEYVKFQRKYSHLGKLSPTSKMAVMAGAFRLIFADSPMLGFYVVKKLKDREVLELGPFQSDAALPPAFIEKGQGSVGRAWIAKEQISVGDINALNDGMEMAPGHNAEIAQPILDPVTGEVIAVFILTSGHKDHLENIDRIGTRVVIEFYHQL